MMLKKKAGLICVSQFVSLETIPKYYSRHECAISDFTDNGVEIKNGIKEKKKLTRYLCLERLQLPTTEVREKKNLEENSYFSVSKRLS